MLKLFRFLILLLAFVVVFCIFYSIIPTIVWIFGGSFKAVAQHPGYAYLGLFLVIPLTGVLFSECFDSNFKAK